MNESKDIPPLLSSKRALIAQLWVSASACFYPGSFALFALVSQPPILPSERFPVVLATVMPPLLLFVTIFALRGHAWATVLSIIGQLSITCLLSSGAIAVAHEPGPSLRAAIALGSAARSTAIRVLIALALYRNIHVIFFL